MTVSVRPSKKLEDLFTVLKVQVKSLRATDGPVKKLVTLREVRQTVEWAKFEIVRLAREEGYSWQEIADALGKSKQSMWDKYHKRGGIQ